MHYISSDVRDGLSFPVYFSSKDVNEVTSIDQFSQFFQFESLRETSGEKRKNILKHRLNSIKGYINVKEQCLSRRKIFSTTTATQLIVMAQDPNAHANADGNGNGDGDGIIKISL